MRRMPIRHRIAPFPVRRCLHPDYAVLVGISPGYPPVAGRLHTCYSPVRRSPAKVSKLTPPLPLDLHVLSLSLAFILSQDQTLRCCILSFSFFLVCWKRLKDSPQLPLAWCPSLVVTPDLFVYLSFSRKISLDEDNVLRSSPFLVSHCCQCFLFAIISKICNQPRCLQGDWFCKVTNNILNLPNIFAKKIHLIFHRLNYQMSFLICECKGTTIYQTGKTFR